MDYDNDGDADYPPNSYTISGRKEKVENARSHQTIGNSHVEKDNNNDSEEDIHNEDDDDDDGGNGVQRISKYDYEDGVNEDEDDYGDLPKHPKKRKLKTLLASYEFAPRVPLPSKPLGPGGRNPLTDWTEHQTFILLDVWGDRFVKQGKKSLRTEEWQEVAEKVSQESKMERTDTQCRNRLDTLKKKYKKEKVRLGESSSSSSEWVYFKKMDTLLSSSSLPQPMALSCAVDSGEYVLTNPKVYLNRSNGLVEVRDSPEDSGNESEGLPPMKTLPPKKAFLPKKTKNVKVRRGGDSIKLLADSIKKFSSVYEKTETKKRHDLVELEKLRMEFHRDLELQKKRILERAQAEIIKIRRGTIEDNDVSADE